MKTDALNGVEDDIMRPGRPTKGFCELEQVPWHSMQDHTAMNLELCIWKTLNPPGEPVLTRILYITSLP